MIIYFLGSKQSQHIKLGYSAQYHKQKKQTFIHNHENKELYYNK
jgi:hypothetical protein